MSVWTALRTWVVGETVSAAQMNAQVRDNLTAAVLTKAHAYNTNGGTFAASTNGQTIQITGTALDPTGMTSSVTTLGVRIATPGTYRCWGRVGGSGGSSFLNFYKNGVANQSGKTQSSGATLPLSVGPWEIACVAGDLIEVRMNCTTATPWTLAADFAGGATAELIADWIAP